MSLREPRWLEERVSMLAGEEEALLLWPLKAVEALEGGVLCLSVPRMDRWEKLLACCGTGLMGDDPRS
jgi:hypothetical protein